MTKSADGNNRILAELIYSSLKEDILNAEIPPESLLEESDLMKRFEVSRTPIREALRRLSGDKLVTLEPRRSAYVSTLKLDEISAFFEAYQIIQRTIFILSANRIDKKQIETIVGVEDDIASAYQAQDITAIKKLNDTFYGLVAAGCSNKFLYDSYIKLREFGSRLSALVHKSLIDDDWNSHFALLKSDHAEIIAALETRDCEAISKIADNDVSLYRKKVLQVLERPLPVDSQIMSSTIAGKRYF
jgi:DNA-binding GntR family transcriptional regulator